MPGPPPPVKTNGSGPAVIANGYSAATATVAVAQVRVERWSQVLDDHDIGVALWARSSTVTSLLAQDEEWRVVFADLDSIVACRRGPACDRLSVSAG